jgi:hypothetical protein
MDRNSTEYIRRQPAPLRKLCAALRGLIQKEFPGIKEEMKWGVPWYGGRFYIATFKNHVNLGFSVEGLSEEELALFDDTGKFMSHIKLFPDADIDRGRITMLLKIAKKSKRSCD